MNNSRHSGHQHGMSVEGQLRALRASERRNVAVEGAIRAACGAIVVAALTGSGGATHRRRARRRPARRPNPDSPRSTTSPNASTAPTTRVGSCEPRSRRRPAWRTDCHCWWSTPSSGQPDFSTRSDRWRGPSGFRVGPWPRPCSQVSGSGRTRSTGRSPLRVPKCPSSACGVSSRVVRRRPCARTSGAREHDAPPRGSGVATIPWRRERAVDDRPGGCGRRCRGRGNPRRPRDVGTLAGGTRSSSAGRALYALRTPERGFVGRCGRCEGPRLERRGEIGGAVVAVGGATFAPAAKYPASLSIGSATGQRLAPREPTRRRIQRRRRAETRAATRPRRRPTSSSPRTATRPRTTRAAA